MQHNINAESSCCFLQYYCAALNRHMSLYLSHSSICVQLSEASLVLFPPTWVNSSGSVNNKIN